MEDNDRLDRKSKYNPCPLCRDEVHTKKQHRADYMREYLYHYNKDKVMYRRGFHKDRFEDVKDHLKKTDTQDDKNRSSSC